MTWVRDRLLKELPRSFDRDPHAEQGLSLAHTDDAWVTIARQRLTIRTEDGPDIVISLGGKTLFRVVEEINTYPGPVATLTAPDGMVSALALIEVKDQLITTDSRFFTFTSLVWRVLVPLSWALFDGVDIQEQAAQQSMSLWSAEAQWLDYWGELYGNTRRKVGETDAVFAARILRTILRPRLNAMALEDILWEDLGLRATITNLFQEAWVVGVSHRRRLAGRKYSRTTFEVLVNGLLNGVPEIIDRSKAAGTLPYYRYLLTQDIGEEQHFSIVNRVTAPQSLLSRVAWVIGRDRCRELPLRGKRFSLFEIWTLAGFREAYLDVSGGLAGDPLVLGTGQLGVNTLGDVSGAGILLSEGTPYFEDIGAVGVTSTVFTDQVTGLFYMVGFGQTISLTLTTGPGASGWLIQAGWWLGVFDGILDITDTAIAGAVAKDAGVNLAVVNGVLEYTPA